MMIKRRVFKQFSNPSPVFAKLAKTCQITQYKFNMSKILLSNVNKMEIHDKIKFFRLSKNLTQAYLADQLSIDTGNYSRLERGETKISIDRITKIAEILEIELSLLLSDSELENQPKNLHEIMTEILIEIRDINQKLEPNKSRTSNGE
jgi:transcriptional regulator with XRE-family HTH domain